MKPAKTNRNKIMCHMYHNGYTQTEIAKLFDISSNSVIQALKRWYPEYYPEGYFSAKEKKLVRLEEIKNKFFEVYEPFVYSRAEIARLIKCNVEELEQMLILYNLEFLRLKTYKSQRTLCNVPDEFFNYLKQYAKKHNTTIRKIAVTAINEYLLRQE